MTSGRAESHLINCQNETKRRLFDYAHLHACLDLGREKRHTNALDRCRVIFDLLSRCTFFFLRYASNITTTNPDMATRYTTF